VAFTDAFTGTNGTDLAAYSANWTRVDGGANTVQIQGNAAQNNIDGTGTETAYTAPDCGTANHYAQAVQNGNTAGGSDGFPVCVRLVDSANFIGARSNSGSVAFELFKRIGGSFTSVGSYSVTPAANDVMKLDMSGTGATFYLNGVSRITGTISDGTFTGISTVGIVGRGQSANPWIDDWESTQGGGGGGGITGPLVHSYHLMGGGPLINGRLAP
jgi:hypothetical protein